MTCMMLFAVTVLEGADSAEQELWALILTRTAYEAEDIDEKGVVRL
jgi:hypothetical protein